MPHQIIFLVHVLHDSIVTFAEITVLTERAGAVDLCCDFALPSTARGFAGYNDIGSVHMAAMGYVLEMLAHDRKMKYFFVLD